MAALRFILHQHTERILREGICTSQWKHPKYLSTTNEHRNMDARTLKLKEDARNIFAAGVDAVLPPCMVSKALSFHGNCLSVSGRKYKVDHNVYVVGFGKAVIGMVGAVENILGEHIQHGIASVPYGIQEALRTAGRSALLPSSNSRVAIMEGARDNLPDTDSQRAADRVTDLTKQLGKEDLLIVLVSGGGSALLPSPIPPMTLQDIYAVSKNLARKGSTIDDLNTVRKHMSLLKGGGLARLAHPAQVISLILSDIIGNQLDMIASGPTIMDNSTPQDCLDIISRRHAADDIPPTVLQYLQGKVAMGVANEEAVSTSCDDHVLNVCIGNNQLAAEEVKKYAEGLGFEVMLLSIEIFGEAKKVGEMFAGIAAYIYCLHQAKRDANSNQDLESLSQDLITVHGLGRETVVEIQTVVSNAVKRHKPMCMIGAGETTVTVTGKGKGGRNQEMSLAVAIAMNKPVFVKLIGDGYRVAFLSGGTDGQDGPTDAAGALADPSQVTLASQSGLVAETYLRDNNSYSFYHQMNDGKDLLVTGLTGTNVMDIQVLLMSPPKPHTEN